MVELLFEFIFEIYIELMMHIVPEDKASSKKYRIITIIIAFIVLSGVLALFIWGFVLLCDYDNKLGIIPIVIAIIISIVQITSGFILHNRNSNK